MTEVQNKIMEKIKFYGKKVLLSLILLAIVSVTSFTSANIGASSSDKKEIKEQVTSSVNEYVTAAGEGIINHASEKYIQPYTDGINTRMDTLVTQIAELKTAITNIQNDLAVIKQDNLDEHIAEANNAALELNKYYESLKSGKTQIWTPTYKSKMTGFYETIKKYGEITPTIQKQYNELMMWFVTDYNKDKK